MSILVPSLATRWRAQFDDTPESRAAYERLTGMMNANALPHHNLDHIADCFEALDWTVASADNHTHVQAALWYHDAFYDSQRKDNEELSADLSETELAKLTIFGKPIDTGAVRQLVMATKHAEVPTTNDAKLIVDIDLHILGTDYIRYMRYSSAIKSEYAWVPAADYRTGRTKVLQSFLDREHIFSTEFFREHYEANARKNLANEIALLSRA